MSAVARGRRRRAARRAPGTDWDEAAAVAMRRFMGNENYDNRIRDDALIDREVLEDIRERRA